MSYEKIIEKLDKIEQRLTRIEKKIFPEKTEAVSSTDEPISKSKNKQYKGTSGGIQYLIEQGFFEKPKSMREIFDELKKEGYFYPLQSVDAAIRKEFFIRKRVLIRIKEGKIWLYAIKK
jgi:transcriptional regulator of heat shock response